MNRQNLNLTTPQYNKLVEVINSLVTKYNVEYIYCFGCLNDVRSAASCFTPDVTIADTHYFLLMLTTDITRIEHSVQDHVTGAFPQMNITILVHGIETVTNEIKQGNRFFNAVCRDGLQMYSFNGLRLNVDFPNLNPSTTFSRAQKHYAHREGLALGFLQSANTCLEHGYYNNCVFQLHQAIEQACIMVIRIYMGYRSDMHNLARLINLCRCFSDEPFELFPRKTAEEKRQFQILIRSYSETRYKDEYQIDRADADKLFTQVVEFLNLIKTLCNNRLEQYRNEASTVISLLENHPTEHPAA